MVGDGCTDHSAAVVAEFADKRLRWFDLPKAAGFGYANRNLALRQATGKLVAFLGHDNLLFPDHLAKLAQPFAQAQAQIAYSRPLWIRDDGVILPFFVNLNTPAARQSFMTRQNVLPATTVVYRRALHESVGMWPEDVRSSGDWAMWKRIVKLYPDGMRFVRQPTCLHFRAIWRDAKRWAPSPVAYLGAMRDAGRSWDEGLDLRLSAEAGLPQAQVAALMQAQGPGLIKRIRQATEKLGDVLAWSATLDPNFD